MSETNLGWVILWRERIEDNFQVLRGYGSDDVLPARREFEALVKKFGAENVQLLGPDDIQVDLGGGGDEAS